MREPLITFETAKLAKEKGFDVDTLYYYLDNGTLWGVGYVQSNSEFNNDSNAPTQSLLQKWILEKHGYFVTVELAYLQWGKYSATVQKKSEEGSVLATTVLDGFTVYDNPEKALEEGLRETLKLI
jgi:hypothetical protein